MTQLLNLFERAPLLRKIHLRDAFPNSSDAPPGRVVFLPHLEYLTIAAQPIHTILLNHLSIPIGAALCQEFDFSDDKSPIPTYLPKTFKNLKNLSHITSINLSFNSRTSLCFNGPGGMHYVDGNWIGITPRPHAVDRGLFQFLTQLPISRTERLAITQYTASPPKRVEKSTVYLTFLSMNDLRILTLINCPNLPFILTLNPKKNTTETVVFPKLEELVLYIPNKDWFCINEILEMAKERASSGAELSTITIISLEAFVPAKEVLKLKKHVSRVEYRLDDAIPEWDAIPTDANGTGYESDW